MLVAANSSAPDIAPAATTTGDAHDAAFAQCTVVTAEEATQILGYGVLPADARARIGGNCFFSTQSMSQDGSVTYALVTAARLVTLRPYFIALARRCAGVAPSSPRAAACAMYVKLAGVLDLDAYYAARTDTPDAEPVAGFGGGVDGAMSADGMLFMRRGGMVVEAAVRRDGAFDLERTQTLARLLLQRLARAATPGPLPSGV